VTLATAIATAGRTEEAHELVECFLANEAADQDRVLRAQALAALANWLTLEESTGEAEPMFAEALATLEHARELPALAEAMARRAVYLQILGRFEECFALTIHALKLAEQHDVPAVALRAMFTQVAVLLGLDQAREALPDVRRGLETARERGDRTWERMMLSELIQCDVFLGRWNEPEIALIPELLVGEHDAVTNFLMVEAAHIATARGDDALLARSVELAAAKQDATDSEFRAMACITLAREAAEHGRPDQVVELVKSVVNTGEVSGELRTAGFALAVDAVLTGGNETGVASIVASLDALRPVDATPVRRAQRARLLAEQAHVRGDEESTAAYEREAVELLRSVSAKPLLAGALLDSVRRRGDGGALAEARAIYEELGATRWLKRLEAGAAVTA
jgi:tetratricopeptide (TPR) repeat protein